MNEPPGFGSSSMLAVEEILASRFRLGQRRPHGLGRRRDVGDVHSFGTKFGSLIKPLYTSVQAARPLPIRLQERTACSTIVPADRKPSCHPRSFVVSNMMQHAARFVITFVSGKVYLYADVPPSVFEAMSKAKSKGQFFNDHIRDQYNFAEVTKALS